MKRINYYLYTIEYAIKRMNPALRRVYVVIILFAILGCHIGWETWQSHKFQREYQKLEQLHLELQQGNTIVEGEWVVDSQLSDLEALAAQILAWR